MSTYKEIYVFLLGYFNSLEILVMIVKVVFFSDKLFYIKQYQFRCYVSGIIYQTSPTRYLFYCNAKIAVEARPKLNLHKSFMKVI